jgi:hypothetical protein
MTPLDRPARSVTRLTEGTLGGQFGKDKHRRLAISLAFGDIIVLRPHGTRRSESILAVDLYSYALRCKANKSLMERLRERKAKKEAAKQAARSRRIIRGHGN